MLTNRYQITFGILIKLFANLDTEILISHPWVQKVIRNYTHMNPKLLQTISSDRRERI